jgi:hypothetical protein
MQFSAKQPKKTVLLIPIHRTPVWVMPKPNLQFKEGSLWHSALANIPGLQTLIRKSLFRFSERTKSIYMDGSRSVKAGK